MPTNIFSFHPRSPKYENFFVKILNGDIHLLSTKTSSILVFNFKSLFTSMYNDSFNCLKTMVYKYEIYFFPPHHTCHCSKVISRVNEFTFSCWEKGQFCLSVRHLCSLWIIHLKSYFGYPVIIGNPPHVSHPLLTKNIAILTCFLLSLVFTQRFIVCCVMAGDSISCSTNSQWGLREMFGSSSSFDILLFMWTSFLALASNCHFCASTKTSIQHLFRHGHICINKRYHNAIRRFCSQKRWKQHAKKS